MASIDKALRRRMERGAQITADAAKDIASAFSRRIPAATSVISDDKGVGVQVDSTIAPNARAFEFGLRHPLNYPSQRKADRWAGHTYRPFLETAAERTADAVANEVIQYADDEWGGK